MKNNDRRAASWNNVVRTLLQRLGLDVVTHCLVAIIFYVVFVSSQPTFACLKGTRADVILVFVLLTLNIFHTFLSVFVVDFEK